jgi:hypothetical protein
MKLYCGCHRVLNKVYRRQVVDIIEFRFNISMSNSIKLSVLGMAFGF